MLDKRTYHFRKLIIVLWVLGVVVLGTCASKLPNILVGDGFETDGTYAKVQDILKEDFKSPNSTLILLFEKKQNVNEEEMKSFIEDTLNNIKDTKGLVEVKSPNEKKEQRKDNFAYATLGFDKDFHDMKYILEELNKKIKDSKNIEVGLTGTALVNEDLNTASQHDLKQAEMIGLPIALVVLLLAFGGLVAASIPLIIGIVSVVSSMGVLYLIGQELDLSIFVLNIVPMIGLALGIDFSLIFINRFREELKSGNIQEAIAVSVRTAGRSIAFSGLCVLLGLSGMLFIQVEIFKTVAIGGMVVVLVSVLSALTFLPALLAVIGKNINSLMIIKVKETGRNKWYSFAKFVMKRPVIMTLLGFSILLMGVIPVSNIKLSIPDASSLPKDYETRTAYEKYEQEFVGKNNSEVVIIAEANKEITEKESLKQIESLIKSLKEEKIVTNINSIFSSTKNPDSDKLYAMLQDPQAKHNIQPILNKLVKKDKTILTVQLNESFDSEKAQNFVRKWDGQDGDVKLLVGGLPKFNQEIYDEIFDNIGYGLAITLSSTFLILMLAFRSIIIPLKAIIMNVISLSATFGILVWLFQEGMFGLDKVDSIGLMIPVFIFGIVFGLSMDYEVFLISRIHEIYEKTGDNNKATLEGLTSTSKIITSAALIMIVVTGAFAFTGVVPVKQMGIGIALSIFIDATIVRMLIVPSLMKLMGDKNWWFPKILKAKLKNNVFKH
ncbi:MMPL family transporter [Priestia megaterium]|uniref:MMPL family transporter n=1 Tax=Priestia megaterium TaxID=1404 RepID=UPI0021C070E1|nr:MMPL family transporter [Priestia megaterium]MCT9852413.1 MMPL family transporter [Priestia megaterium]MDF1964286.1 MMPL family transporter [Priestia megaterium]